MDNDTPEATRRVSRRGLVKGAAGAAAVGAAAVAVTRIPGVTGHGAAPAAQEAAADTTAQRTGALPKQDWAIYVRDADSGDLDIFVGTQHFAVHDSDLVARVVAAAG
jgi:hypothetical protein